MPSQADDSVIPLVSPSSTPSVSVFTLPQTMSLSCRPSQVFPDPSPEDSILPVSRKTLPGGHEESKRTEKHCVYEENRSKI